MATENQVTDWLLGKRPQPIYQEDLTIPLPELEARLESQDKDLYDLRVNGIRHIAVKESEGTFILWDVIPGIGMIKKYERGILDV